jgi:heme exporter protein A
MNEIAVNLSSISKSFERRKVLADINLHVSAGESVFVCGINGVGKSTLLRIASGLLAPDDGSVRICNGDLAKDPEKTKTKLGVISHKSMLYSNLTVHENLTFFAKLYGVADCDSRIDELLANLELNSFRYDKAEILSRGLLQRLAIARALIHSPSVLLADEPFTGLDRKSSDHLISFLNDFVDDEHLVLMTTHDVNFGLMCCSRVIVLDNCKIIFDAAISDVDIPEFSKDYLIYARSKL